MHISYAPHVQGGWYESLEDLNFRRTVISKACSGSYAWTASMWTWGLLDRVKCMFSLFTWLAEILDLGRAIIRLFPIPVRGGFQGQVKAKIGVKPSAWSSSTHVESKIFDHDLGLNMTSKSTDPSPPSSHELIHAEVTGLARFIAIPA